MKRPDGPGVIAKPRPDSAIRQARGRVTAWFGADPGGADAFGVALLRLDGSFESAVVSCADKAFEWQGKQAAKIDAAGIDAPLWWSSGANGERLADKHLRDGLKSAEAKHVGGTVQSAKSLRGAVLAQGVMLATRLRQWSSELPITEAHPKALLKLLWPQGSTSAALWTEIAAQFCLD